MTANTRKTMSPPTLTADVNFESTLLKVNLNNKLCILTKFKHFNTNQTLKFELKVLFTL